MEGFTMTDSLTTLIGKVQALLGDDGTIFDTTLCTAAAREALKSYNMYLPINAGTLIDAVTDQYEYELTDTDLKAMRILDILLQGENANEQDISLTFDEYSEDERIFFRLRCPQTTGETLIARYTVPQTINGLDSETETTMPAWIMPTLVTGIAAEALRIRARARVETINLNKEVRDQYSKSAQEMKIEYLAELRSMATTKRAPVGEPDQRAWNDKYHNWEQ
jgi:hypothetical protein